MYKRAIVPLDGSPEAEAIVPFILDIAGPLDIEVILLQVVVPVPPQVIEGSRHVIVEDVEARLAEAREYLAPIAARLESRGVRVDVVVRHGRPAEEILAAARERGADLIAMTTHGRSGIGRLLFGSVTEAVLRHAEIPVLALRITPAAVAQAGAAR